MERYAPLICKNIQDRGFFDDFMSVLYQHIWKIIPDEIKTKEEAKNAFEKSIDSSVLDDTDCIIPAKDYVVMTSLIVELSQILYFHSPEFFFPYFYTWNIFPLVRLSDFFGIELPQPPKKTDYRGRCMYYWQLCEVFYQFRKEYGLSTAELCAFLYDFAPKTISQSISEDLPKPSQIWCVGGLMCEFEAQDNNPLWQGNKETKRGDIILHYETSPISAITTVWQANTNGIIDPFFHYYSEIYLCNKISVPAITLKELKQDPYFREHPLTKKNFQGVNGFSFSSEDYNQLKRIWKDKGFDTTILPELYAPSIIANNAIKNERDVELTLLEPLLAELGIEWVRQLPIRAGRGHRIFPDYALYMDSNKETAPIIIEAKYHMKNNKDIDECFSQARSYANILESSYIILCDKNCIFVYERSNGFDRNKYKKYYWDELKNPDTYNLLKKIMEKR